MVSEQLQQILKGQPKSVETDNFIKIMTNFSQLFKREMAIKPEIFHLSILVDQQLVVLAELIRKKRVIIEKNYQEAEEVFIDKEQMTILISTIIRRTVERAERGDKYELTILVKENDLSISMVDKTRKMFDMGEGLELYLVRLIVERMKGQITNKEIKLPTRMA
jgi:signal transduction histidine kinase